MLLAIDTATRWASIALYGDLGIAAEATWRSRENHTVELTVQIVRLMELANVRKSEVDGIGVSLGPGSFTGLRVGMSVAKGLTLGSNARLVGVPTLDVVAYAHACDGSPLWALVPAGRGRYCVARYRGVPGSTERVSDYALVETEGLIELALGRGEGGVDAPLLFCGEIDAELRRQLVDRLGGRVRVAPPAASVRRAGYLAEIAWARLARNEFDDAASLSPLYTPFESVGR
ncbi:MAG: tRNA (adenosine(37)-N6)-threonylcarbamoyltransferase complex dimerization subunit type 1 TsaB [Chloroflexi bacterium]|nr:tRNA (adenosine(37)-N6)-threonylcarbamoyltransferase complex dimerization subunit type 1 TsaB [Chloroflexota bacterium]